MINEKIKKTVAKAPYGYRLVSTIERPEFAVLGWGPRYETAAFRCDRDGEVTDWVDIVCWLYDSKEKAPEDHAYLVRQIEAGNKKYK